MIPPNLNGLLLGGLATPPPLDEYVDAGPILTAWLNECPDGTVIDCRDRRFTLDTPWRIADRHLTIVGGTFHLRGDGTQAAKPAWLEDKLWPRERAALFAERSTLRCFGTSVIGDNLVGLQSTQANEEQAGFELRTSSAALVGCRVNSVLGGGVTITHTDDRVPSVRVHIEDLHVTRVGRNAIALTDGTDVRVEGLSAIACGRSVINLEPAVATWRAQRVQVHGVRVENCSFPVLASQGQGTLVSDVEVSDVVGIRQAVRATVQTPRGIGRRSRFRLSNWSSTTANGGQALFRFRGIDDLTIDGCSIPLTPERPSAKWTGRGVELEDCTNWDVDPVQFYLGSSTRPGDGPIVPIFEVP